MMAFRSGMIFRSMDDRENGRKIMVVGMIETDGIKWVEVQTVKKDGELGRKTHIRADRMREGKRGWKCIHLAMDGSTLGIG